MPNELKFDEKEHRYSLDGRRLVSVTQALSLIDDRPRDTWYLERGRLIHLACELHDRDELDEATVDPQILPYLNSYRLFLATTSFKIRWVESRYFHPAYFYAGTIDRIETLNEKNVIIDIKSGAPSRVDPLQLAAYFELVKHAPIYKCFDLYLKSDGGMPKLEEVERPRSLLPVFLACLKLYQWKEGL